MQRVRHKSSLAVMSCTCALLLCWGARGHASPLAAADQSIHGANLDEPGRLAYLARFHDGPRSVPAPRDPWRAAADQLGIGSTQIARSLLWISPSPALLREVGAEKPKLLLWPVVGGRFERGFGLTRRVRKELPHKGIDIAAPVGTAVRAAADGLVLYSDNGLRGYGNCVLILHDGGLVTLYAHNQRTTVQAGQRVERGERIALVGQTGYAWGPHLHFELRDNGRLSNPMSSLVGRESDALLVRGQDVATPEAGRI